MFFANCLFIFFNFNNGLYWQPICCLDSFIQYKHVPCNTVINCFNFTLLITEWNIVRWFKKHYLLICQQNLLITDVIKMVWDPMLSQLIGHYQCEGKHKVEKNICNYNYIFVHLTVHNAVKLMPQIVELPATPVGTLCTSPRTRSIANILCSVATLT